MTTSPNPQDASAPAFPTSSGNYAPISSSTGMTLRDYFAAKAMQAFLSGHIAHHGHENHWPYESMAAEAFDVAKAMLRARQESSHDR